MKVWRNYTEMWRMALKPRDDLDKLMRFPMALHAVAVLLAVLALVNLGAVLA